MSTSIQQDAMPLDIDNDLTIQTDAAGNTGTVRTTAIGGLHYQHMFTADPATGAAIKPASQADIAAVLAKIIAAPSTEATQASLDAKTPALVGGKVPVTDPGTLPLPAGAATSALQTTGNASLASLDAKTGALSTAAAVTAFTSTTAAQVVAANASRKRLLIYNQGAGTLSLLFGAGTASASSPFQLRAGDMLDDAWSGAVQGIFLSAGTATIQELS